MLWVIIGCTEIKTKNCHICREEKLQTDDSIVFTFKLDSNFIEEKKSVPKWGTNGIKLYKHRITDAILCFEVYRGVILEKQIMETRILNSAKIFNPSGVISKIEPKSFNYLTGIYLQSDSDSLNLYFYNGDLHTSNYHLRAFLKTRLHEDKALISILETFQ